MYIERGFGLPFIDLYTQYDKEFNSLNAQVMANSCYMYIQLLFNINIT